MRTPLSLAFVAVALLGGCMPSFEHALPADDPADSRLLGPWSAENDEGTMIAEVRELGGGRLEVVLNEGTAAGKLVPDGERMVFVTTTTAIGKARYLSVEVTESSDEDFDPEGYFLCLYDIIDGTVLEIRCLGTEPLIEDIEAGLLAGSVNRGEWVDEVTVSSDGAALAAYLAAADTKRLFEEEAITLRRTQP